MCTIKLMVKGYKPFTLNMGPVVFFNCCICICTLLVTQALRDVPEDHCKELWNSLESLLLIKLKREF